MVSRRVVTVVGARPQFVKAAMLSRALAAAGLDEVLVHTGQHHDAGMSDVFFEELKVPAPRHHLGISGGGHGAMTGRMLAAIEPVLIAEAPAMVVVYGDTNSTLAGALAAAKLRIPVAHVEAGLRSFDRGMPEEINRVLTDRVSDVLFAPSDAAAANLAAEGISGPRVVRTGDIMLDAFRCFASAAGGPAGVVAQRGLSPGGYVLATVHRAENTDDPARLAGIMHGLARLGVRWPVLVPLHPRTRGALERAGIDAAALGGVRVIEPVGYLEMTGLVSGAGLVATDSGGLQKEAAFAGVPCVTLRDRTEWVELLERGLNVLVGCDAARIAGEGAARIGSRVDAGTLYGDGHSAEAMAGAIARFVNDATARC